jgi:hypothetical protein
MMDDDAELEREFDRLIEKYGVRRVKKVAKGIKGKAGPNEKHKHNLILLFVALLERDDKEKKKTAIRRVLRHFGLIDDERTIEMIRQRSMDREKVIEAFLANNRIDKGRMVRQKGQTGYVWWQRGQRRFPKPILDMEEWEKTCHPTG